MQRGDLRVSACQEHDKAHHTKGLVAKITLQPYGLGYQLLGLHHSACLGTHLVRNHLLQVRPHHDHHLLQAGWERMTAQNPPVTILGLQLGRVRQKFISHYITTITIHYFPLL